MLDDPVMSDAIKSAKFLEIEPGEAEDVERQMARLEVPQFIIVLLRIGRTRPYIFIIIDSRNSAVRPLILPCIRRNASSPVFYVLEKFVLTFGAWQSAKSDRTSSGTAVHSRGPFVGAKLLR